MKLRSLFATALVSGALAGCGDGQGTAEKTGSTNQRPQPSPDVLDDEMLSKISEARPKHSPVTLTDIETTDKNDWITVVNPVGPEEPKEPEKLKAWTYIKAKPAPKPTENAK